MACDLSIVMGKPVAVLRYATLLANSLTRFGNDSTNDPIASSTLDTKTAADTVAPELVAAVVPVAESIWVAGRKSVMDYAMAGMQLAKIQQDWQTVLACLQLAARVHPNDATVVEGIAEARAALNES